MARVEFILLPYDTASGNSLIERLIGEMGNVRWSRVRFAVAFALQTGNYNDLLQAMTAFCARPGTELHVTFGADSFASGGGSEYEAVETVATQFAGLANAHLYLFREAGRTFHPKVYVFDGPGEALVIMGSSNWSCPGMERNEEANAVIHLDLARDVGDRAAYAHLESILEQYWSQPCP